MLKPIIVKYEDLAIIFYIYYMKNSYDQHNIEFTECRKNALLTKLVCYNLIIVFVLTPLYKIIPDLISCTCWEPFLYRHINFPINSHPCDVILF